MYSIQGLWSAAQLGLPIAFLIIRNGRYEALHEFGPHFGLQQLPGTELPQIDFCGLARSQGVRAVRVERCDGLDAALTAAFQSAEPILVEVVTQAMTESVS
jgi:benzoylformate decarboxylase